MVCMVVILKKHEYLVRVIRIFKKKVRYHYQIFQKKFTRVTGLSQKSSQKLSDFLRKVL
jgi:hypothetical protein